MKTVLLLPGYQESYDDRNYTAVLDAIRSKGYDAEFVPINWTRTTITEWLAELDKTYDKYNSEDVILAGFSYGAMTAFVAAAKRNPSALWLFSLSPWFAEDIPNIQKSWVTQIGHRRADAFRSLNFNELVTQVQCPTLLFYGSVEAKDYPLIKIRSAEAHKIIADSKLIEVQGSEHDVSDPRYIAELVNAI